MDCREKCLCPASGLSLDNGLGITIYPGNIVILGRFQSKRWEVGYGWFSYDGHRQICGWYLTDEEDPSITKPIQDIDLLDVYAVEV